MYQRMINCIPQHLLMLAGFVLMLGSVSNSHAQDFEGKKITSVTIRYNGPRTVDEAKLRGFMATRAGQIYSAARLDEDVRSLYESGLVDDIRFFAEAVGSGVKVIAEVKTRAKFIAVGFMGNTIF